MLRLEACQEHWNEKRNTPSHESLKKSLSPLVESLPYFPRHSSCVTSNDHQRRSVNANIGVLIVFLISHSVMFLN